MSEAQASANPNLRPCPDCGNLCSLSASSCPKCGRPFKTDEVKTPLKDSKVPCVACGFLIPKTARVCVRCGQRVGEAVQELPLTVKETTRINNSKRAISIGVAILSLLAIAGVLWWTGILGKWLKPALSAEERMKQERELFKAAVDNDFPKVHQLILQGADVNTALGRTKGKSDICTTPLIASILAVSSPNDNYSALSVREKRYQVVRALIEAGADVNTANEQQETALMFAAADDDATLVEMLVKAGANPDARDRQGDTESDWGSFNRLKKQVNLNFRKVSCFNAAIEIVKEQKNNLKQ